MQNLDHSVSVIIPAFNNEGQIADAISSVLKQEYCPLEIIVIDDGSTDGTRKICSGFKDSISYFYQANAGPAAARNRGLKVSGGNVIGFLDADDVWLENSLRSLLRKLEQDPQIGVVMGLVKHVLVSSVLEEETRYRTFSAPRLSYSFGSALVRRYVFDRVGLLDEGMSHSEDIDWFMRARESGIKMTVLQEATLLYRIHPYNLSRSRAERHHYFLKALKKSLDRRRKGPQK